MKTINVLRHFTLTLDDHTRREFHKGVQEVEDFIPDHWYVKDHSRPVAIKEAVAVVDAIEAKLAEEAKLVIVNVEELPAAEAVAKKSRK
jgi:hypothetical protein